MTGSRARWALLGAAAAASGVAALLSELLWVRRLGEMFGHTAYAVNVVLAVFFLGLGIGGWLLGRLADRLGGPLLLFVVLEAIVALSALAFLPLAGRVEALYLSWVPAEWSPGRALLVKAGGAALLMAIPTLAMGGTLPALTRHLVRRSSEVAPRLGWLYGANTVGAAAGAASAVFLVIPTVGMTTGFALAAAASALSIVLAWLGRGGARSGAADPAAVDADVPNPRATRATGDGSESGATSSERRVLLVTAAVAGFVSVGLELVWTRALAARFLSTVYSFASILVAYLLALGVGSLAVTALARLGLVRRTTCAVTMAGAGLAAFASLHVLSGVPVSSVGEVTAAGAETRELAWALAVMIGPLFLFGLNLPVLVHLACRGRGTVGADVGSLYLSNTLGAVAAPVVVGFGSLAWLGLGPTMVTLAWMAVAYGLFVLLPWSRLRPAAARTLAVVGLAAAVAGSATLPDDVRVWSAAPGDRLLEYHDGVLGAVAVVETVDGDRVLKVDNSYRLGGTRTRFAQQRQSLLPLLLHPDPRRVLMIGLGTGSSAGAACAWGDTEVDILEIVGKLRDVLPWFDRVNDGLAARLERDPGVRLLEVDARHFVAATDRRYELVIGDLFVPWRAGEGAMYTREHFTAVRDVLAAGGLFCQWLPLYQLRREDLSTVVATFLAVFPDASAWWLYFNAEQPVIGLVGRRGGAPVDAERLAERVGDPARQQLLRDAGLDDARSVLGSWLADSATLRAWTGGAEPETRDRPRIEFGAPSGLELGEERRSAVNLQAVLADLPAVEVAPWWRPAVPAGVAEYHAAIGHFFRGRASLVAGDPADAVAEYAQALERTPAWSWIVLNLDALASEAARSNRPEVVRAAADALADSTYAAHLGFYHRATAELVEGREGRAREWLERALEIQPDHAPSRELLGRLEAP